MANTEISHAKKAGANARVKMSYLCIYIEIFEPWQRTGYSASIYKYAHALINYMVGSL
jgi:hypothetical protein